MQAITVGTTPVLIAAAGNRDFVHVYNNSANVIYLAYDGDDGTQASHTAVSVVTTVTGMPLPAGAYAYLNNDSHRNLFNKEVWAVSGSAGCDVRVQGA